MKLNTAIIFFSALMLILAVGYFIFWQQNIPAEENQTFCTQEVLLCPDGSCVSRKGNLCAFEGCPYTGPITGDLEKMPDGFRMIIESPDKAGQEVTYALPLETSTPDGINVLAGQRVRAYGTFGEGINFIVSRIETLSGEQSDITLGNVSIGKPAFINGVRITLNKIVQDSRCPIDVKCIWAGSVTANVSLKSDTDSDIVDIKSGKQAIQFDSFLVSIVNVEPIKDSSAQIIPQSYVITFKVSAK